MKAALYGLIATTLLLAASASAHHSFAMFDNDKVVTVTGTVREFQWTNPHSWVFLVVKDGQNTVEWNIETGSPNILRRTGWSRSSLNPGDKVSIIVHPAKSGTNSGALVQVVLANGETLFDASGFLGGDRLAERDSGERAERRVVRVKLAGENRDACDVRRPALRGLQKRQLSPHGRLGADRKSVV